MTTFLGVLLRDMSQCEDVRYLPLIDRRLRFRAVVTKQARKNPQAVGEPSPDQRQYVADGEACDPHSL